MTNFRHKSYVYYNYSKGLLNLTNEVQKHET